MSELQKLAEMNDVALGAAVGGGVGAAGGLLATLLRTKPSLKKGLINMLIGGTGGAAIGGGVTALSELANKAAPASKPVAPVQISEAAPTSKSMSTGRAAASGLAPIVGPAIDGYQGGGAEQALRSAGRSSLEALGGSSLGLGLHLLAAKKGINIPMWQAQATGALAGSAHGAYAAAANFNEREKAAYVDAAVQSPVGQSVLGFGSKLYNKLPAGVHNGVANAMLKNPQTMQQHGVGKVGFAPGASVGLKSEVVAHNDEIVTDRVKTVTPGTAGRPFDQLRRGFLQGRLPAQTYPAGAPIQERVEALNDDITTDVLEPIAKKATAQDVGRKIDTAAANIGGLNISPLSGMGGAAAGGTVGAALGGGAGLLGALFDGEDDGLVSTLSKALSGGALGGLAGAGVGAVGANYLRKGVMDRLPYAGAPGSRRNQVADETLKRFVTPVSSLFNRATGRIDKQQFGDEVAKANTQEALMHTIAPYLLHSANRNNQR